MKKLLPILFLTGCVAPVEFTPTTKEGAQCKVSCSHSMSICRGSPYSCEKAAAACLQSCKELEKVTK